MDNLGDRSWHPECPPIVGMLKSWDVVADIRRIVIHADFKLMDVWEESLQEALKILQKDVWADLRINCIAHWGVHGLFSR